MAVGKSDGMCKEEAESILLDGNASMFGPDTTSDAFRAGVLLLLGLNRRKDTFNMTRATGYPADFVSKVRKRLIKAGVWKRDDKMTYANWDGSHEGQVAFMLDAMAGAGLIERVPEETT